MITISVRNFRSPHSVHTTECGERNFLTEIVARKVRAVCYSHTAHANLSLAFREVSAATSAAVQSA